MDFKKFMAYFILGTLSFYILYFFIILPYPYEIGKGQFFMRSFILIISILVINRFIIKKVK